MCPYTRFFRLLESNCNGCNVGDPKMVELLHLFAENGLSSSASAPEPKGTPVAARIGTSRLGLASTRASSHRRNRHEPVLCGRHVRGQGDLVGPDDLRPG